MSRRQLSQEQIERACELRETRGLSAKRIVKELDLSGSPSSLSWHFLVRGADKPNAKPNPDFYKHAGRVCLRNGHVVRRFTAAEDLLIENMALKGATPSAIGRALQPPRQPNAIRGRLATLARHAERSESMG